jgi:hypothetical protein
MLLVESRSQTLFSSRSTWMNSNRASIGVDPNCIVRAWDIVLSELWGACTLVPTAELS